MTDPQPLQSQFSTQYDLVLPLYIYQYPLFSLMSFSNCVHLLPRLPVTSKLPSIFLSINVSKTLRNLLVCVLGNVDMRSYNFIV